MNKCLSCKKECKRKYCNYQCYWNSKKGVYPGYGFKKGSTINIGRIRIDVSERNYKDNPSWKKYKKVRMIPGELISWNSYKLIYNTKTKKYEREHRLVIENKLKRKLKKTEVVHHINGDRQNNKISNLILFKNQSEHRKYHGDINGKH